ncbi:MAG: DUF1573 domain-containing protein [Phycisphaerales bacterium]|nr:DUF1573 domain-containing protein [Phycisphaerales bacterium]MCB9862370.1 DUF1573 domain-containing protein [Phycisphaerales bacterium]
MRSGIRDLVIVVIVTLAGFPALAQAQATDSAATPPQPVLKIDSVMANAGERWIDQPIEHTFRIHNAGNAELTISRIDTPSDVTAELKPATPLAPNGDASLVVKVDGKLLRPGAFEKRITLNSNDPRSPQMTLTLSGVIRHFLEVTPSAIGFGKLDGDGHRERKVTIVNRSERPVSLTMVPSSLDKHFEYDLIETSPGHAFELYVDAHPPYEPGTYRGDILIKTNNPSQPELSIGVFAIMPERVEVLPRVISIATPATAERPDAPSVHVLNVQNNGDKPVHVTGATCEDKNVKVVTKDVIDGRKYRVQVKLPANYTLSPTGSNIILKTDDAEFPVLTVTIAQSARRATPPRQVARNTPKRPTKTPTAARKKPVFETIGKPAPTYDLKTMDGFPVTNLELEGHPATVLNFFAPNCPHCKRQLPKVEQIRLQFEPMGVRFVNVSEKMRKDFTPEEVLSVVSDLGANAELAIDPGNVVGRRFKATGYPCLIVIDPKGVVSHVVSGNKKNIVEDVSQKLESLIANEDRG